MLLSEFDYELPEDLIAQQPLARRDASRMLVVNREQQSYEDSVFVSLPDYLKSNDTVVVNNTRVFPARLIGQRDPTAGRVEVLLVREVEPGIWEALVKPGHRLKDGARLRFGDGKLMAEIVGSGAETLRRLKFEGTTPLDDVINEIGETPLPPYIKRSSGDLQNDRERYQTLFAQKRGAIAAPTAGLHFTPQAIERIVSKGARVVEITLHVGYGTFQPVRVDEIAEHRVAQEFFQITEEAAGVINSTRADGGRIIAVGTTTTRALESSVNDDGTVAAGARETDLTILPGYKFRITDALLTNFHLPQSSLLLLVSAFSGRELTLGAYRHAVAERYRFYSYGDCMFVF